MIGCDKSVYFHHNTNGFLYNAQSYKSKSRKKFSYFWLRQEQLTVNVIYVKDGEKKTSFLTLLPLKGMKSEQIFEAIKNYLESNNVPLDTLIGFASDGAANMRGVDNGVSVRMNELVEHPLITLHCVCHCVALSAQEGLNSSRIATWTEETMKGIVAEFQYSTNANRGLEEFQLRFNEATVPVLRVVSFSAVRWCSREGSMVRICKIFSSIVNYFKDQAETWENTPYFFITCTHKDRSFRH